MGVASKVEGVAAATPYRSTHTPVQECLLVLATFLSPGLETRDRNVPGTRRQKRCATQFRSALMRMRMLLPDGRPQIVSFVPVRKRLVCTVKANQFVLVAFVLNSGINLQLFVPVDLKTRLVVPVVNLTIRIVGGGMVNICPPKR